MLHRLVKMLRRQNKLNTAKDKQCSSIQSTEQSNCFIYSSKTNRPRCDLLVLLESSVVNCWEGLNSGYKAQKNNSSCDNMTSGNLIRIMTSIISSLVELSSRPGLGLEDPRGHHLEVLALASDDQDIAFLRIKRNYLNASFQ